MRDLKTLAAEALAVQDACNLSGVVGGFCRAIRELREIEPDRGTDFYNHHHISVLWADKIKDLAGDKVTEAFLWASDLVEGKNV